MIDSQDIRRRQRSVRILAVILTLVLTTMTVPASAFIIDSFDDAQSYSANSGMIGDGGIVAGGMLGGERYMDAVWFAGPNSADINADAGGSSLLSMNTGAGTTGDFSFSYCGVGCTTLGPVDFTGGGALDAIGLRIGANNNPVSIEVGVFTTPGSGKLTLNLPGGIVSPTNLNFPFVDFVLDGGASLDFSSVFAFGVAVLSVPAGTNLEINFVETKSLSAVPEPSTYAMAVVGLLGLGLYGWRRRLARHPTTL